MVDIPEPHIARDYKIGNTRVIVATNYCEDKTPEDVQKILDRIARKVQPGLVAAMIKEQEELNKNK